MVHLRIRTIADAISQSLKPPAEVYLLHMGKVIAVKTAGFQPAALPDKKGGATGPEYRSRVVILPMVFFDMLHDASPTKREPEPVQETSCGAGILKQPPIVVSLDLWLGCRYVRMSFHVADNGIDPARRYFDV